MPSRTAHRAALRRAKEPALIPPAGLDAMPDLPAPYAWRNTFSGYDWQRDQWAVYRSTPGLGNSVSLVIEPNGLGGYTVVRWGNGESADLPDAIAAVRLAAEWMHRQARQ